MTMNAKPKPASSAYSAAPPEWVRDIPVPELPAFPDRISRVTEYGAVGDGLHDNTRAFADAIADCAAAGGGTVVVPPGVWATGPIRLRSNVRLHAEAGALVLFSPNCGDYPLVPTSYEGIRTVRCAAAIYGADLDNVAVTGPGVFDGAGESWRPVKRMKLTERQWQQKLASGGYEEGGVWWPSEQAYRGGTLAKRLIRDGVLDPQAFEPARDWLRPTLVQLDRCRRVLLDGPTFQNSAAWNVHPWLCEHVTVRNVTILNPSYAQNGDGLDVDSCRYVSVSDSVFDVGDDAICLKSGKDADGRALAAPTEFVTIRNCRVYHGHGGFVVGSEMSGGVRDVLVENCTFAGTDVGLRFKTARGRGGTVERIAIRGVGMKDIVKEAVLFSCHYFANDRKPRQMPVTEETPVLRDIHIADTVCVGARTAVLMHGLPEMPIRGVRFERVVLAARRGALLTAVRDIVFRDARIRPEEGPPYELTDAEGVATDP